MEQRGIKKEQVERAIRNPGITLPTRDRRRKRARKTFGTKTLDVIYEPRGEDKIVLVTAAWAKEKNKKAKR